MAGALIFLLVLLAYIPAIRAGYIWDDDSYVTHNFMLRSLGGLWRIWFKLGATPQYYPLVHTGFWIEYHLWGLNPLGFHLTNVLLHAACALLFWRALLRLEVPGAWFAAAIFALHPVHVESVAWVTERKNVLSGFFYLSSALAYMSFLGIGKGAEGNERKEIAFYILSLLFFASALLSKTVTCTLPASLLLISWWKRPPFRWKSAAPLLPMFLIGIPIGLLTAWIEKHHLGSADRGAQGPDWDFSLVQRCLIAGRASWFYAGKLLLPFPLTFIYPRWAINPPPGWMYIFPILLLLVIACAWILRGRMGRGPLVAISFFVITLGPALGFFNVYPMLFSFVADHFQYLASLGLIALFAATIVRVTDRIILHGTKALARYPFAFVQAALLIPLFILTWRQGRIYADEKTLWQDTLAKNPSAWIAHNNLGKIELEEGALDSAFDHFSRAIDLKADFPMAYNNAGIALGKQGKVTQAVEYLRKAISLNSEYADAYNNLAFILLESGKIDEALPLVRRALELNPDYAGAHNTLGMALGRRGNLKEAEVEFAKAVELDPGFAEARYNLGAALYMQGDKVAAAKQYEALKSIRGEFAQRLAQLIQGQPPAKDPPTGNN